jgi:hypothetical protein
MVGFNPPQNNKNSHNGTLVPLYTLPHQRARRLGYSWMSGNPSIHIYGNILINTAFTSTNMYKFTIFQDHPSAKLQSNIIQCSTSFFTRFFPISYFDADEIPIGGFSLKNNQLDPKVFMLHRPHSFFAWIPIPFISNTPMPYK